MKLFYLRGEDFKVLKELRNRFVGKLWGGEKGSFEAKKSGDSKNHRFISPIRDVSSPGRDNPTSVYEATQVWNTRDSLFWGWRRAAEYFRDLLDADRSKEAYQLMAS